MTANIAQPRPAILLTPEARINLMVFLERVTLQGREAETFFNMMRLLEAAQPVQAIVGGKPQPTIAIPITNNEDKIIMAFLDRAAHEGREAIAMVAVRAAVRTPRSDYEILKEEDQKVSEETTVTFTVEPHIKEE